MREIHLQHLWFRKFWIANQVPRRTWMCERSTATFLPVVSFSHHLHFCYPQKQDMKLNRFLTQLNADTILFIKKVNDFYFRIAIKIESTYDYYLLLQWRISSCELKYVVCSTFLCLSFRKTQLNFSGFRPVCFKASVTWGVFTVLFLVWVLLPYCFQGIWELTPQSDCHLL